jgi:hypothetical protein
MMKMIRLGTELVIVGLMKLPIFERMWKGGYEYVHHLLVVLDLELIAFRINEEPWLYSQNRCVFF